MLTFQQAAQIFKDYSISATDETIKKEMAEANRKEYEDGEARAEHYLEEVCNEWADEPSNWHGPHESSYDYFLREMERADRR